MAPLLFEIGLDSGRVFAKCLIFNEFILWLTYRLSKKYLCIMHPNLLHGKSTDLFIKNTLQETNGLDLGCKFLLLWFSYRMVVETLGRTSVPNSNLSTHPHELVIVGAFADVILQVTIIHILSLYSKWIKGGSNVLLTKIMSILITVIWKEVP